VKEAAESHASTSDWPLLLIDYPNYEVLVVDDGSTDATAQIPPRFPGRLLSRDRLGVCRARNVGLGQAEGELVAHIDADALADPDWFTYLALTLEVPGRRPSAWRVRLGDTIRYNTSRAALSSHLNNSSATRWRTGC